LHSPTSRDPLGEDRIVLTAADGAIALPLSGSLLSGSVMSGGEVGFSGGGELRGFYGFPPLAGSAGGVKVATEQFEHTTEPDGAQHPATPDEAVLMRQRVIGERLPWLGPTPLRTVSCLYTSTRASRFVIDRHPAHENVVIVSACSGHGFKHSPAVGEAVARWIAGHSPGIDLRPFQYPRA
jgi:sarcosine oxidase